MYLNELKFFSISYQIGSYIHKGEAIHQNPLVKNKLNNYLIG